MISKVKNNWTKIIRNASIHFKRKAEKEGINRGKSR